MNLDLIKSKLDSLENKNTGNNTEKKNLFWKPTVGK